MTRAKDIANIISDANFGGTLDVVGVVTANAGVAVDNITIDGTEIDLSSGHLTIDVAGDINLDSDSGYVLFKDGGTEHARIFQNNSGDVNIGSQISDKDIKFNGNDGGVAITALTLDMSAAGKATFNSGIISNVGTGQTAFYSTVAGAYQQFTASSSNAMAFGMTNGNVSPATASTSFGFHHWNNSSWVNPVGITRDGITFNGDTAEANALDDYEEGTWTPSFNNANSPTGAYTKIGNMVFCTARIATTAGGSSGSIIGSLPFTSASSNASRGGGVVSYQDEINTLTYAILIEGNSTAIIMRVGSAAKELSASKQAFLSFSYRVA